MFEFLGSITKEQWEAFQGYGFFLLFAFLVVVLYAYWFHLYRSEKKGRRDYEKYAKLALDGEIDDKVLEQRSN